MPEKTAEITPNNSTAAKMEETTRKYIREAETTTRDTIRMYNDMMRTTTNYYFDTFGKAMNYGIELNKEMTGTWENMFTTFRHMYTDNYKMWENYWDEMYKAFPRPR